MANQGKRNKSVYVTFTTRPKTCVSVKFYRKEIPQCESVKSLDIHLDKRLTWKKYISTKCKQFNLLTSKMYWLLEKKSKLTLGNKVLIYKVIIKPIWTYGIMGRFQSKTLRVIANAPLYATNETLHQDLGL